jgi:hypothetical protein
MDLEATAQGYGKCLDTFNLTKELKRKLGKTENRKNDEGEQAHFVFFLIQTNDMGIAGHSAKRAKMSGLSLVTNTNNLELRQSGAEASH